MAKLWRHWCIAFADDRLCERHAEAERSGLGADFRRFRPRARLGPPAEHRCSVHDLQRSHHSPSSSIIIPPLRSASTSLQSRRRRWRSAPGTPCKWPRGARPSHRHGARRRRIRHVVLPGQAARPWLPVATLDDGRRQRALARQHRAAPGWRAAIADPERQALLQTRQVAAQGDPKLSRPELACRRDGNRRPLSPSPWRTRRLRQRGVGQ